MASPNSLKLPQDVAEALIREANRQGISKTALMKSYIIAGLAAKGLYPQR